jgi:hypothetical protein
MRSTNVSYLQDKMCGFACLTHRQIRMHVDCTQVQALRDIYTHT